MPVCNLLPHHYHLHNGLTVNSLGSNFLKNTLSSTISLDSGISLCSHDPDFLSHCILIKNQIPNLILKLSNLISQYKVSSSCPHDGCCVPTHGYIFGPIFYTYTRVNTYPPLGPPTLLYHTKATSSFSSSSYYP